MNTLLERLEFVMKTMNWSQTDLKEKSGESSSVVSQWLGKGSKTIKSIGKLEAAERLERETGFSALWLAKGIGPMQAADTPPSEGRPQVGQTMSLSDVRLPPPIIEWGDLMTAELPPRFQTRVPDDSLTPLVPAGSLVTFDRTIERPRPGDGVLVKDESGALYFRRFREGRPGQWEAYSMNNAYRTLQSDHDKLVLIGVFVGSEHRLG